MIHKMSSACARNLISLGNLHDVNEPVLCYGCELILTSAIGLILLIALSLLIGQPLAWLFFVIGFAPHRTCAGGYHADTHIRCFTVTSLFFLIGTSAAYGLEWHRFAYIVVSIISAVLVFLLAPLAAVNKPLSANRYRANRTRSLIVVSGNIIISVFFAILNLGNVEANMYFAGIFFASASLIMGKIKIYVKGGQNK